MTHCIHEEAYNYFDTMTFMTQLAFVTAGDSAKKKLLKNCKTKSFATSHF